MAFLDFQRLCARCLWLSLTFGDLRYGKVQYIGVSCCTRGVIGSPENRQRIFENQVGRALDATDDIAHLLSCFMLSFMFLQGEPYTNHESGEYHTPHDQSWSRSSCQLHTDSKFLFLSDLGPLRYGHPTRGIHHALKWKRRMLPLFY